jgi:hypothetical protein
MKRFNKVVAMCAAAGFMMFSTANLAMASGIISGKESTIYGKGNGSGNGSGNGGNGSQNGPGNGTGTCTNLIPDSSHDGFMISGKGNGKGYGPGDGTGNGGSGPKDGTGNGSKSGTCTKLIMDAPEDSRINLS